MSPTPSSGTEVQVDVEGRTLTISNLAKVLYPRTGTTKGEVLNYYAQVSPVLLPHLKDRAVTRIRWPHGVEKGSFFEKNKPPGTPFASTVHWWTCSSRAARLASQVSVARSSQIGKVIVPSPLPEREPVVGTSAVRTHEGVPGGAFFSKKLPFSTPCGQRIRVTARSLRCGSSTGETWA